MSSSQLLLTPSFVQKGKLNHLAQENAVWHPDGKVGGNDEGNNAVNPVIKHPQHDHTGWLIYASPKW